MLEATDFSDGSSFAAAMAGKDPVVQYRRASYGEGGTEPFRIPSFSHGPNYWAGVGMKSGDCSNPDRETHRLNLMALKAFYEQSHPGCKVNMETRLRAPGDPPRDYSPDLAVIGIDGTRLVAVEYQRSREAYEKFADRDDLRLREGWACVDWWFDHTQNDPQKTVRTVYDQSEMHRTHLAAMGRPIYRCWVDPLTFVMQYDYGCSGDLPPGRRKRVEKHIERAELKNCSIAQAIRDLEGEPEEQLIKEIKHPLRARPQAGVQGPGLAGVHPGLDLKYHLERERRVAEAAIARRSRLDEQDRLDREFGHKCRLSEEIHELAAAASVLGDRAITAANTSWTADELENERERLSGLQWEAELLLAERRRESHELLQRAESQRKQKEEESLAEQRADAAARAEAWQLEQQRIREEQAKQWAQAEEWRRAELQLRQEQEAEEAKRAWEQRWGVPIGSTGIAVSWRRGIHFTGQITRWANERPVIEGFAGKKAQLRWAFTPDDYILIGRVD
jgi:hypothetical protein